MLMRRRRWSGLLLLAGLVGLAGCTPVQRVDDQTVRFTTNPGAVALMLLTGVVVSGVGGLLVFLVHRRSAESSRGRSRKSSRKPQPRRYLGGTGTAYGVLIGGLLLLVGAVPGMLTSHVTVTPEEVRINDSLFWFVPSRAHIRFADVRSIFTEEEERLTRRGRRTDTYFVFEMKDGTRERVKAGALLKAAQPAIEQAFQAAQSGNQPAGTQAAAATRSGPDTAVWGQPTRPPGRNPAGQPAGQPRVPQQAGAAPPTALDKPPPGRRVTAATRLQPGVKLEAFRGNQWLPVEVLAVQADGMVKIHWVGYADAFDEVVARNRLRLPAEM